MNNEIPEWFKNEMYEALSKHPKHGGTDWHDGYNSGILDGVEWAYKKLCPAGCRIEKVVEETEDQKRSFEEIKNGNLFPEA